MIDRMSSMISEILHEEQRSVVTTQELLDAVMAQISSAEYADLVHTENRAPEAKIRINKIRFSRVLINLVENAAYAVRRPDGKIWIRVEETEGAEIRFQVEDNGTGIPKGAAGRDLGEGLLHPQLQRTGTEFRTASGGAVRRQCRTGERGAGGNGGHRLLPPVRRMCVRQDQYELKGAVLEAPLEWQGSVWLPDGGRPGHGAGGDGPAAVPAAATVLKGYAALAADRQGNAPPPAAGGPAGQEGPEALAAVWYGRAAEAEDQHGTLVACYNGFGTLPGALPLWRRAWHAGWAAPGRSC